MTKAEAEGILTEAFLALDDDGLGNLLWHARQGTTVCCGEYFDLFVDGSGGG